MKNIRMILMVLGLVVLGSCDQERLEPEYETAAGGGTLKTYMAYAIGMESDTDIYGRVVFYEDALGRTLVQVSVYNTTVGEVYPTSLVSGMVGDDASELLSLYAVEGKEYNGLLFGEMGTNKFYTITDTAFYGSLSDLDAHINLYLDGSVVATGAIGANADPVEVQ